MLDGASFSFFTSSGWFKSSLCLPSTSTGKDAALAWKEMEEEFGVLVRGWECGETASIPSCLSCSRLESWSLRFELSSLLVVLEASARLGSFWFGSFVLIETSTWSSDEVVAAAATASMVVVVHCSTGAVVPMFLHSPDTLILILSCRFVLVLSFNTIQSIPLLKGSRKPNTKSRRQ